MSVRGFLTHSRFPRDYRGLFRTETGRPLEPTEARENLLEELSKGRETIPCDATCANPCPRSGCAGFDFGRDGGCPGHDVPDEVHP